MEPITLTVLGIFALGGWAVKKIADNEKEKREEETKHKKLKAKTEIETAKIKVAEEANKKLMETENKKIQEKHSKEVSLEQKIKDLENAKNRANDSSLSESERSSWRNRVITLEEEISRDKNSISQIDKELEAIRKERKKNNDIISSVSSSVLNEGFQLQDFLNIKTVAVVVGGVVIYKLLKDDK